MECAHIYLIQNAKKEFLHFIYNEEKEEYYWEWKKKIDSTWVFGFENYEWGIKHMQENFGKNWKQEHPDWKIEEYFWVEDIVIPFEDAAKYILEGYKGEHLADGFPDPEFF